MQLKQPLFIICLAIALLSLAVSFYMFDRLSLALAALVPAGAMLYARIRTLSWLAHVSLAGFVGLAAVGTMLNAPLMPMVVAVTAALAAWDLELEMQAESPATALYERQHLIFLGLALGLGLLGVGFIRWINWQLSFVVMLGLGILLLVCLDRVINYFQKNMKLHR